MRLKDEIDANLKILSGDPTFTVEDRAVLAEFPPNSMTPTQSRN
jgi:hypothetical protein